MVSRLSLLLPVFARVGNFASPKSKILACPRLVTRNVGRLDVAMNDAFRVRGVQCVGNLDGESEQYIGLDGSS